MQLHAEPDRSKNAFKQNEVAVASGLDDAPAEACDQFFYKIAARNHEFERAKLVTAHHRAVSDQIGEDYGEAVGDRCLRSPIAGVRPFIGAGGLLGHRGPEN